MVNDPKEEKDLAKKTPKITRELKDKLRNHIQNGGRTPWMRPKSRGFKRI